MRVLIVTLGTRGDVQPMIALALALRARGHVITFCGPSNARPAIELHGLPFVDIGFDARRFLDRHPEFVSRRARALRTMPAAIRQVIDEQFRALEGAGDTADLVIAAGAVSAPSSLAEARGIPYRFVAFGSMAIPSRLHPPYLFPRHGLPAPVNVALWLVADVALRVAFGAALNAHRRRLGLPPAPRLSLLLTPPGSLLLAADPELSPPPLDYDPAIPVTGALLRAAASTCALPAEVEAFLAAGPAPVYIGFGSMTDPDPERTTRVLLEAIARAGIRAIVSSGWAGLGATLPPECLAVGEVPHDALFSRLAGAVHHGGAGTTATAARAGIPQPIVPHMLDQFYWAHRTATLGIGPRAIPKRSLDGRRLAAGMMALTRDEGMRRAARSLGALLRPRDGVAAAVKAIEFAMGQAPVTRRAPYAR